MPQLDSVTFLLHYKFLLFVFLFIYFNFELYILPSLFMKNSWELLISNVIYFHILKKLNFVYYYLQLVKVFFFRFLLYFSFKLTCTYEIFYFNTLIYSCWNNFFPVFRLFIYLFNNIFFFNELNNLRFNLFYHFRNIVII